MRQLLTRLAGPFALAAALLSACATPLKRPPPPVDEECPAEAEEAMKKLKARFRDSTVIFPYRSPSPGMYRLVKAKDGPATVTLDDYLGDLPRGTLLTGKVFVGREEKPDARDRLYGSFYRAYTPDGRIIPVCIRLRSIGKLGATLESYNLGPYDNLWPIQRVEAFESPPKWRIELPSREGR